MKRLLVGFGALLFAVVAAGLIVPFFLPKETIKREIVAQVEAATGWRLRIDGPVGLSLLPGFNLSARDVGLSGEAGADGIEFVKIRQIDFSLALSALIGGQARITGITLVEPRILLEVDKWGRTSWAPRRVLPHEMTGADPLAGIIAGADGDAQGEVVTAADAPQDAEGAGAAAILRRVRLDALTLKDGALAWSDLRTGVRHEVNSVNVTLAVPSLEDTATLEGSLDWRGVPLTLAADVAKPLALAMGEPSDMRLTVSNDLATARLAGTFGSAPLGGSFALDADGASLGDLLAALHIPVGDVAGLDAFAIKASGDLNPASARVSDISAAIGETVLTGALQADIAGQKPVVKGDFAIAQIDLDQFRAPPAPSGESAVAADGAPEAAAKSAPATAAARADSAPLDLSGLGALDADIGLTVGVLKGAGVEVRDADLSAVLQDGLLAVTLAELRAFGGSGGFALNAHQRDGRALVSGTARGDMVDLAQLMAFAGRSEALTGTLTSHLSYASEGATSEALLANMEVQGTVRLDGGSYAGLGLAEALDAAADRLDNIDVEVAIAGLDQPVKASGGLDWRGERFALSATASPAAMLAGKPMPVQASLSGNRLSAGVTGTAAPDGAFDGRVSVRTPDLRGLLAWVGRPLGPGGGLGPFSVSGRFNATPDGLSFEETDVSLDGTSGRGEGSIQLSGAVPVIKASFALEQIALDPYLGADGATSGQGGNAAAAAPVAAAAGWSTEPIDFAGLKAADADLDITTKGITWDKLTIGASRLTVGLKGGVLNADLKELALYGGTATGRVLLDGQAEVPRVAAVASLGGLSAHPLLRDAAGFDWIEGTAAIDLDVAASGRSQAELVGALSGSARTSFTDGAIRGINIPQMMRGLSVQTLLGWQSATAEKTDFSELSGSFAIDKGVARNTDLKMVGPLVRISGSGTTDMPRKYLDWRVEPKVVASLKGQGAGDAELAGLGVPVIIRGPWDKPKIYPDIAGILENPDAAYKQLREIGGGLLSALKDDPGKAASEALKQVTNGGAIDVQKVIDGEADTDAVLKALEDGFNLPSGIFGFGKKK